MHFVTKVIDHIIYTKKICNTFNQIKAQISTIKTFIIPVSYALIPDGIPSRKKYGLL